MPKSPTYRLLIECFRAHSGIYHVTQAQWAAAARRHRALGKRVTATIVWDREGIDEALQTADMMITPNPPRERLRERAPRLKWIQNRGAGINHLMPLDWLPSDLEIGRAHV